MRVARVEHVQDVLDGRSGFSLRAEWGFVSALLGGGHICQFESYKHPGINPLWRPQWKTIDPDRFSLDTDLEEFGPMPDGRLLAGIAGHSISFDYFGPPSAEEIAAGLSTHGEAPSVRWQITSEHFDEQPSVEYGAVLPSAQIDFKRVLRIDPAHPVVYCEEKARNLSSMDRPISWNEHITIGPPFLECGVTMVDMPATQSRVIAASYSDAMKLTPDADFWWPNGPLQQGGIHDLRSTPDGIYCRYTAQLLDRTRKTAYVAISNPRAGVLLVYLFNREDFPWVGNWEERFYHKNVPWGGKTFCRGIEFSTTPFAQPRRQTISEGPLFNEGTYRWLPAASEVKVRFISLMMDIPPDYKGVNEISIEGDLAIVQEIGDGRRLTIPVEGSFLAGGATSGI